MLVLQFLGFTRNLQSSGHISIDIMMRSSATVILLTKLRVRSMSETLLPKPAHPRGPTFQPLNPNTHPACKLVPFTSSSTKNRISLVQGTQP